jgi:hypothetical protein
MTSKAVSDIRASSYDAATANAVGYSGSIDDALAQIRAEDDIQPFPISARTALLMFLGVTLNQPMQMGAFWNKVETEDERDALNDWISMPSDIAPAPGPYSVEYAMQQWPENFRISRIENDVGHDYAGGQVR